MKRRDPTADELRLHNVLVSKANPSVDLPEGWQGRLRVIELDDGGMGGLLLLPGDMDNEARAFGRMVSDCQFTDADGVVVIASLYLDRAGIPFELDIWKTDFGRVIRIPSDLQ